MAAQGNKEDLRSAARSQLYAEFDHVLDEVHGLEKLKARLELDLESCTASCERLSSAIQHRKLPENRC
jgi:hypothetical protein